MFEFFEALIDPNILFLRHAFIAGILASVAFGIIGTFVVVRRISYIAGAISHCVLGGIGAGLYLQKKVGLSWCDPMGCALVTALAAAIVIGLVSIHAEEREDSVIGALWACGMAAGLLFIARTPGYIDPMSYLFGDILLIEERDLWVILGLDVLVSGMGILFYNKFLAVCFDDEFLRLRGIRANLYYLLLLCLTALTVVLLVRIVGIVMVIALLTLPASIAGFFSGSMWRMMASAVFFSLVFTTTGLGISYTTDMPSGPVIIAIAGTAYLLVVASSGLLKKFRG